MIAGNCKIALAKIRGIIPERLTIKGKVGWGILTDLPRWMA
jgi:hypothetical protein